MARVCLVGCTRYYIPYKLWDGRVPKLIVLVIPGHVTEYPKNTRVPNLIVLVMPGHVP